MLPKVSQVLKEARSRKNLSLEVISRELKIQPQFLAAIESGDFSIFSSPVQLTGFLKNYARFLSLSVDLVLAFYRRDFGESYPLVTKIRPVGVGRSGLGPEKITGGLVLLVFLFFFGYLLFYYQSFFRKPELFVFNPAGEAVVRALQIEVRGRTCLDCRLAINGQEVNLGPGGSFRENMALKSGTNTLSFSARNKAGRETQIVRHVVVEP